MRKPLFAYAKTKAQISFDINAKLISAFVFATRIVQFLFFRNPKFQASNHFLRRYRLVCVRPGQKPEDRFSRVEAYKLVYRCKVAQRVSISRTERLGVRKLLLFHML